MKAIFLLALIAFSAHASELGKFRVRSRDRFGNVQEYFTGYVAPSESERLRRPYREFPFNKGAMAFQDLPKEFSLKENVQRIFYQRCGDCWAQGGVTAFETLISWADKASTFISRQQVIDCSGFGSCGGGQISVANFKSPKGAVYESDYPYSGSDGRCKSGLPLHQHADDVFYVRNLDWPTLQRAVWENGPLEVCGASSALANGGWVSRNAGGGTDHCYGLVGWLDGASHNKPPGSYAIIANSWGTNWGDAGYGYYLMAKDGVHLDGNVITEAAGFIYKPACSPQPLVDAGPDKSLLLEGK